MITVKNIALKAGISPSTVSIVLSGKAKERHISEETSTKILNIARELGYYPNISAKRLRSGHTEHLVVAVYWASDFRTSMLSRLIRGLTATINEVNSDVELIIHPYTCGHLSEDIALHSPNAFNGAILGNATKEDLEYLERNDFFFPIVLYNRHSNRYPSVTVDDVELGRIPARIFSANKCKRAAIIASEIRFASMDVTSGIDVRSNSFIKACSESGINISSFQMVENSMSGGYMGCKAICSLTPLPDCLFCASDYIAMGVLRFCNEHSILVPKMMQIISVGNGSKEMESFCYPGLSVIVVPIEDMASESLRILLAMLDGKPIEKKVIPTWFVERESCRLLYNTDIKALI